MPRKSREREREQLRKESKRQRVEVAERAAGAQAPSDAADVPAPAPAPDPAALQLAAEIAGQLGETEEEPRATILRAVERVSRAAPQQARLRLVGRPSKIPPPDLAPETPYVIFNLESGAAQAPPLSSDLPPVGVTTTYRVLATTAQWRKVVPALVQQPDARIGVVGLPAINPKRPGVITVRATGLKLLVPRVDEGRTTKDEGRPTDDE